MKFCLSVLDIRLVFIFLILFSGLTACGSGGGGAAPVPKGSTLNVAFTEKTLAFSWSEYQGATHYKFYENVDGASGFSQLGSDLDASTRNYSINVAVHLQQWSEAQYMVEACTSTGCVASNVLTANSNVIQTIGQLIASNPGSVDEFGTAVSISGDGNYIAIGAPREGSASNSINGDQSDNSAAESGAVYVFSKSAGVWTQQAYLKSFNSDIADFFGNAISLNADGTTLAVSAYKEDSVATGVNGDQADNSARDSGAVYIFTRSDSTWTQQAYIKASNTENPSVDYAEIVDHFGTSIDLNDSGNILAIGSPFEDGAGNGGEESHNCATNVNCDINSGAVYIFSRTGEEWVQTAYLKASNREDRDNFGTSVSISGTGNTLVVGTPYEDGSSTGVNNTQNNLSNLSGAAYVFNFDGTQWIQQAYLKASNTDAVDFFGIAVELSGDGNTIAVGSTREASSSTGINGEQGDNSVILAGAVYIFTRNVDSWTQQAYLKASNTDDNHHFGVAMALNYDGSILAVGASGDDSLSEGINGNQNDNSSTAVGAVYTFVRSSNVWTQRAYVKSTNPTVNNIFGYAVAMSSDGSYLLVGEKTGVEPGFPSDHGSVYIY